MSKLYFRYAAMNAGKSTNLLQVAHNYEERGREAIIYTAALLATPPSRLQFDAARIVGAVPISGVFDFVPLLQFSFNADFKLTPESARELDLYDKRPAIPAPLVIAAGANESSEFRRQSTLLAERWKPQVKALQILPGLNHFSIVDAFAERGQPLYEAALGLFA